MRVERDCLCWVNWGGSVSLRVSRGGSGSGWDWDWDWDRDWDWLGLVEERSLVVDSRPRPRGELSEGEHLQTTWEGAPHAQVVTDEGTSWSSKMSVRGELVTVWVSTAAIGSPSSTGSAAERSDQSSASAGERDEEKEKGEDAERPSHDRLDNRDEA